MEPRTSRSKLGNSSHPLHQRLHLYTLAASAAGVSLIALALPGEAEIIYTPANQHITPNGTYTLDVNGDGTTDFKFTDFWQTKYGTEYLGSLHVLGAQAGNGIVQSPQPGGYAAALHFGAPVGPAANFASTGMMAWGFSEIVPPFHKGCLGPWKNKHRYLGFKFKINSKVHYGWARLKETCVNGFNTALLQGYAYETVPNQGVKAGVKSVNSEETLNRTGELAPTPAEIRAQATLGMLAKGSPVLEVWRRE